MGLKIVFTHLTGSHVEEENADAGRRLATRIVAKSLKLLRDEDIDIQKKGVKALSSLAQTGKRTLFRLSYSH